MGWVDLSYLDAFLVGNCVQVGAETSDEHVANFGNDFFTQAVATVDLCKAMIPVGGVQYVQVKYLDSYTNAQNGAFGRVALFFQKMKWMSAYNDEKWGDVWVMSVVFDQGGKVLPEPGSSNADAYYEDFLKMLHEKKDSPLQKFLDDNNVTPRSLFTIAPNKKSPDKDREIAWLEYVARDQWKGAFGPYIEVNSKYMGSHGKPIEPVILQHWGSTFYLTEIKIPPPK